MTQSIVRAILLMVFTWMISKGWVTQQQVDSSLPSIVGFISLAVVLFGGILWAYLEKLYKGFFPNSPFPPSNIPSVEQSTKSINNTAEVQMIRPPPITNKTP